MFYISSIRDESLHLSVHRHNFERRGSGCLAQVPGFVRVVFLQHHPQGGHIDKVVVVKVAPPLLVGPEEVLELLLHLAAQREAVVGGGAVGHHQVLSSPGHQLGVLGVGVGEEPGVVLDQADPGLQEDDQPGVVVLLCGLDADVDLPQYAGLAGTQVVRLLWVQLLPSSSRSLSSLD